MSTVQYITGEFLPSHKLYIDEINNPSLLSQFNNLMNKVNSLESQIQKAMHGLQQRERFVNDMAADLDHIMTIVINKIGTDKKVRIEPIF